MALAPLEYGAAYISESGDQAWVAVGDNLAVRWCIKVGWIQETAEAIGDAKAAWDVPSGVLWKCWCSTSGALDDLTNRFIQPALSKDTTKRQYRTSRSWSVVAEEDEPEGWLVFRLHKLAIRVNHE